MAELPYLRTGIHLRCPRCKSAELEEVEQRVRCPACGAEFACDQPGGLDLTRQSQFEEERQREVWDRKLAGQGQRSDPWRAFVSPAGLRYGRMLRTLGLAEGRSFLEIGCGAGPLSDSLGTNTGAHGVAIDISPASIQAQLERRGNRRHWDPVVGSALDLPFPDATFDAAVSTDLLEHLDRPEQFYHEVARVIRPGGRALIRVNVRDIGLTMDWLRYKLARDRWQRHMHDLGHFYENFRSKSEHRRMAVHAGFEVKFIRGFDVMWDNLLEYSVLKPLFARMRRGEEQAGAPATAPPEGYPLRFPTSLPHRVVRFAARLAELTVLPDRLAGMLGFGASAWILLERVPQP